MNVMRDCQRRWGGEQGRKDEGVSVSAEGGSA